MSEFLSVEIATFDGGYSRSGVIDVWSHPEYNCHVCGAMNVPVLSGDGSDGEYATGRICEPCAIAAFAKLREAHDPAQRTARAGPG